MPTGRMLGRWRLETKLGEGATSNVWLAVDQARNITVALKVLKTDELDEHLAARRQMRMMRESEALVRSAHPNVVRIVEIGRIQKRVFLAMEHIDGVDLQAWIKTKRTWQEVILVYLQAARGLAAAHKAGIVHRDFKPANVMLGNDGRAVVTDFGLARSDGLESDGGALGVKLTAGGVAVGTPRYMASEQHQAQQVDARTDQFAWGVALFEGLYGQHPYAPNPRSDVAISIAYALAAMGGKITPPPEPAEPIPEVVAAAVRRAIDVAPSERFGSMDEAINTIETGLTAEIGKQQRTFKAFIAGGIALTGIAAGITIGTLSSKPPECRPSTLVARGPLAEPVAAWSTWFSQAIAETCDATRSEGYRVRLQCLGRERAALEAILSNTAAPQAAVSAAALEAMITRCSEPPAPLDAPRDVAHAVETAYEDGRAQAWQALLDALTRADAQGVASSTIRIGEDAKVEAKAVRGQRREAIGRILLAYGRRSAAILHLNAAAADYAGMPEAARAQSAWLDAEIAGAAADASLGDLTLAEERVTALIDKLAAQPSLRARALESRAWIRGARGAWPEAIADAREAVRVAREALGETHPYAVDALFALASVEARAGSVDAATPKLDEVIRRRAGQPGPRRAEAMFALARATARSAPDRGRALAVDARAVATEDAALVASIDAWLAGR